MSKLITMSQQLQKQKKLITVRIDSDVHKRARIRLFEQGSSFQNFLNQKIEEFAGEMA